MWLASVYYCYIYSRYSPIYVYICYNVSNFDSLSNQIHKTSIAFSDPGKSPMIFCYTETENFSGKKKNRYRKRVGEINQLALSVISIL